MKHDVILERAEKQQAMLINCAKHQLLLDASGALIWPKHKLLVVSDLHFEKGSYFASRGSLIPQYDSRKTLSRLTDLISRYQPQKIVCLGDSFHDLSAWLRFSEAEKRDLASLVAGKHEWIWVLGNHDPDIPEALGGTKMTRLVLDDVLLCHEPEPQHRVTFQVFGHFHPKLTKRVVRHKMTGRCFVLNATSLVLPAFGAYAGGLNIDEAPLNTLFNRRTRKAYLIYEDKLHRV